MLEIKNIEAINKGSLLASCSVHIIPWHMWIHKINIFQKGVNRWLVMPTRLEIKDNGSKEYEELITFDSEAVKNRFRGQILEAIDKFIESNPDLKPEDVIKNDDGLPF